MTPPATPPFVRQGELTHPARRQAREVRVKGEIEGRIRATIGSLGLRQETFDVTAYVTLSPMSPRVHVLVGQSHESHQREGFIAVREDLSGLLDRVEQELPAYMEETHHLRPYKPADPYSIHPDVVGKMWYFGREKEGKARGTPPPGPELVGTGSS